jgi:glyoxylase-like metal-dependent hydrolase (beta-lactamase superfamily II)
VVDAPVGTLLLAIGLLHLAPIRSTPAPLAPVHRVAAHPASVQMATLRLVQYVADSSAYDVGSTLVLGPTESLLIDAQYHWSDAKREAEQIASTGTHLKAIFITHPDEDHYTGAAALVERFPGTPVYMTAAGIEEFRRKSSGFIPAVQRFVLRYARFLAPKEAPDSLVTPQTLPATSLSVDAVPIEIVPDQQGDVLRPTNSFVWIPSLRAVIAGDIVFNGVHPWLAASSPASREAWHRSIQRIADLHPTIVIAGHKSSADAPDTPDVLEAMSQYLTDFDAARATSYHLSELVSAMKAKYPRYAVPQLLEYSAKAVYHNAG